MVAKKLVEVRLVARKVVNTPVEGVFAPIGVLSIAPPFIVRASTTIEFVIESFGKLTLPETNKLVVDTPTNIPLVEVTVVPDAAEKNRGPDKVPPTSGK